MEMVSNILYSDVTTIKFLNEATAGFDNLYDAYKKYSLLNDVSGMSTTISGFSKDVAVNTIPELTADIEIPVKINIRQAGEYTLSFSQTGNYINGSCLILHDIDLDSTMQVDMNTVYTFTSPLRPESAPPRFVLSMSPPVRTSSSDATCFEGNDGSAKAIGVGAGPFTYSWYDADNTLISEETTADTSMIADLAFGFYKVVIDGNDTECGTAEKEFFIAQPAALENEISGTINPTCTANNGQIKLKLDSATVWDINWTNTTTGQTRNAENVYYQFTMNELGAGTWEVTTTSHCGDIVFETVLDDGNDVVSDFTMSADTVYISEGGEATFTNTSENASSFIWWYSDNQEEPDYNENGAHIFTSPGVYNIILWAQNEEGCFDIYDQELVVMQTTGVNELSREHGLIRSYISYGNGGNPQYVIELDQSKVVNIELRSTMGQLLYSEQVMVNGETRIDLPVNSLSSGIYMVITLADGTRIDTQKLFVR